MATKKNGKGEESKVQAAALVMNDAGGDVPEIRANVLDGRDRDLLARGQRFLTMIQSPAFAARAARSGYTSEEHKEGWALLNLASGQGRRLDDCFHRVGRLFEPPAR